MKRYSTRQRALNICQRRLDSLVRLKTSPDNELGQLVSDEEYARQRTELLREKTHLESVISDPEKDCEQRLKQAEAVLEMACYARRRFAEGDAETKRHILSTVGSNLTLKDKMLSIEARRPFSLLDDSGCGVRSEKVPLEPKNDGSAVEPIHGRDATCPSLLSALDQVRTIVMGGKSLFMYKSAVLSL